MSKKGKLYIAGDKHGEFSNTMSYSKRPLLRELGPQDVMLILGDCGVPFGVNMLDYKKNWYKHDKYELDWMSQKPFTWALLAGNHDDRDAIAQMPIVEKWGGQIRQMKLGDKVYDNIFYIDTPQILDICGKHCLCIPGATSHDADIVLDPNHPNLKRMIKALRDRDAFFRINHWNWWENEDVDCGALSNLLGKDENLFQYYDYVFSHESPALWELNGYGGIRRKTTAAQDYLEILRKHLFFYQWYHGHQHQDFIYPEDKRITCVYYDVIEL